MDRQSEGENRTERQNPQCQMRICVFDERTKEGSVKKSSDIKKTILHAVLNADKRFVGVKYY